MKPTSANCCRDGWRRAAEIIVVVAVLSAGCVVAEDAPVATVNGQPILRSELLARLLADHGRSLLDELIKETIVEQAAQRAGIKVTAADVDAQIAAAEKAMPPGQTLAQTLEEQGISMASLRAQVRMRLQLKKMVEPSIRVDESRLRSYFQQQKAAFVKPEQVHLRIIYVPHEGKARLVAARAQAGEDFKSLVDEFSQDAQSKSRGGDIGFITRTNSQYNAAFVDAVFAAKSGDVLGPLRASFGGFYIVKVEEHRAAVNPTFEQVREQVRDQVYAQELQRLVNAHFTQLRKAAKVETMLSAQ